MDPILNQGLSLSLEAFGNYPAHSLCDEVNELPLHLRKEKLALQFTIRIAANPNYSVNKTIFNLQYVDYLNRKLRVIPTFGICVREFLEELNNFYPDIIAKFQFLETPLWTYVTQMVNLILTYATKDRTDPSIYSSLHDHVKNSFKHYD